MAGKAEVKKVGCVAWTARQGLQSCLAGSLEEYSHAGAHVCEGGLGLMQKAIAVNKLYALLADVCQPQVGEGLRLVVDIEAEVLADLTLQENERCKEQSTNDT